MPAKKGDKCAYRGCEGCVYETGCVGTKVCMPYRKLQHTAHYDDNREQYVANVKQYRIDHPETTTSPEYKAQCAKYKNNHRVERYIQGTILNHKRAGYDVQFNFDELMVKFQATKVCRYCGQPMTVEAGHTSTMKCASLDRTNNEMTMTLENTQFICKHCNITKGARTHAEFIAYMRHALELNE